jgi:hypothetical protein
VINDEPATCLVSLVVAEVVNCIRLLALTVLTVWAADAAVENWIVLDPAT